MSIIVDKFGEHVVTSKISIFCPQCVKEEYKELARAILDLVSIEKRDVVAI